MIPKSYSCGSHPVAPRRHNGLVHNKGPRSGDAPGQAQGDGTARRTPLRVVR